MKLTKQKLKQIIKEELAVEMATRLYQASESRPAQIMHADQELIRYLKNYIANMVGARNNPQHDPEEVVEALQHLIGSFSLGIRQKRPIGQSTGLPPTMRTMDPLRETNENSR